MRFKSFKIGKLGDKSEEEAVQEDTVSATEVAEMEEKMADKTKKLKDAEMQLKGLTDSTQSLASDDDEVPGPHGPLIELTVEPGDELLDVETETELNSLMNATEPSEDDDIKVVEVISKDTVKVGDMTDDKAAENPNTNEKNEQVEDTKTGNDETSGLAPEDSSDDFSNLFSDEEEESNPLSNLINAMPEVSAQELVDQLEEIKEIIRERQQG